METGGFSAIDIVLWVLAANAVVIFGALGLVMWWRKQVQETIRQIGEQIQVHAGQLGQVAGFLQNLPGSTMILILPTWMNFGPRPASYKNSSTCLPKPAVLLKRKHARPTPTGFKRSSTHPVNWFRR